MNVIILTGASRGYGEAIVKEIFEIAGRTGESCRVLGIARTESKLEALKSQFPHFEYLVGDVTSSEFAEQAVNQAIQQWGRIDTLVHNAGYVLVMNVANC